MAALRLALLFALSTSVPALAQRGVPQSGYPNWQERMTQVLFNRVRAAPSMDPKACTGSEIRPPLVWNYNLNRAARFHSSNLVATTCFQHNSPCLLHADIASRVPPTGSCDGSAACACSNAAGCKAACTSDECTQTFARIALFGTPGGGEIIARGQTSPRGAVGSWMGSNGHCEIILSSSRSVGSGWLANTWTGNFGNNGNLAGSLIAGGHEVGTAGQFTTDAGQDVAFRVNYFNTAGAPQLANLNLDGTCSPMELERGDAGNATYLATFPLSGTQCRRYRFSFKDPAGVTVLLPETGSYGVGGALASCPDWSFAVPTDCPGMDDPSRSDGGMGQAGADGGLDPFTDGLGCGCATSPGVGALTLLAGTLLVLARRRAGKEG